MDLKSLTQTINQIAEEKKISPEKIFEVVEKALAAAYRREYASHNANVKATLNPKTGEMEFFQIKEVVDEDSVRPEATEEEESRPEEAEADEEKKPRFNSERHIMIDEARKIDPEVQLGGEIEIKLPEQKDFGRIAAGTAKQVIVQRLREVEQESVVEEFKDKEDQIVSGIVQRIERGNVYLDLGRAVGIMFRNESIPGEHYRIGERLRFYVIAVQSGLPRTPEIILSRAHPRFIYKLFEMEVPEIAEGSVEIKAIAREAGFRTKIAVASNYEIIDAVGSVVGQRGTRIMAVTNELGQERVDVVGWSEDPEEFIKNSLAPATVHRVEVMPRREARVFVSDDQLSLAIGRGGQNVRLAAKLTGWKIDVRSESRPDEAQEGGIAGDLNEPIASPAEPSKEVADVLKSGEDQPTEEVYKASEEDYSQKENED